MAQYQEFDEAEIHFKNGYTQTYMEWTTVDIRRPTGTFKDGEPVYENKDHQLPTSVLKGDLIGNEEVESVFSKKRHLKDYSEFAKNAKKGRLKELRTTAKLIGFGMLFGMSAGAFANGTLKMEWDVDMCKNLIRDLNLSDIYIQLSQKNARMTEAELLYLTVATFFRREFFKLYPVLEKWIAKCAADATVCGYARSSFGARRLLPQLLYQGRNSDGAMIKNLSNISVNSPVQDFETIYMSRIMIESNKKFEELELDAIVVGTVHDSIVLFANRDIKDIAAKIVLEEFARSLEEFCGIPYEGECNVADPLLGEVWGMGKVELTLESLKDVVIPTSAYAYKLNEENPISEQVRVR